MIERFPTLAKQAQQEVIASLDEVGARGMGAKTSYIVYTATAIALLLAHMADKASPTPASSEQSPSSTAKAELNPGQ